MSRTGSARKHASNPASPRVRHKPTFYLRENVREFVLLYRHYASSKSFASDRLTVKAFSSLVLKRPARPLLRFRMLDFASLSRSLPYASSRDRSFSLARPLA